MRLNTKRNYRLTLQAGREFRKELAGHNGYASAHINAIALQERIVGWITCQRWFKSFNAKLKAKHPRDGGIVHASDLALEATSDLIRKQTQLRFRL